MQVKKVIIQGIVQIILAPKGRCQIRSKIAGVQKYNIEMLYILTFQVFC